MAKTRKEFVCLSCGRVANQWAGRCLGCGEWNTLSERELSSSIASAEPARLVTFKEISSAAVLRLPTGLKELDRVLGGAPGGIVSGSVLLIAGSPGAGKSTLLLQAVSKIQGAVYISAEESLGQLRLRAERLKLTQSSLQLSSESSLAAIMAMLLSKRPPVAVIDSIQTIFDETLPGTPGSIVQVRETCWRLQRLAKESGITIIVVGHITKDGQIAGPKTLEHLVDVVLYLEGEKRTGLRILRSEKNRFGSTEEVGIWQLTSQGLIDVADPGQLFAELIGSKKPGRALTITIEGSRAFIVEVQALISKTVFGYPKRVSQGIDATRLSVILAVVENWLDLPISSHDVFINVVGGFTIKDPGADLAIAAAILSAVKKRPIASTIGFVGEIGLLGEVRPAHDLERRKKEAARLGYQLAASVRDLKKLLQAFDGL